MHLTEVSFVFLLLLTVQISDACLKVRWSTCQCTYLSLNSSTVASYSDEFSNLPTSAPTTVKATQCVMIMSCTGDYTLVIFRPGNITEFPSTNFNGQCDKDQQGWIAISDQSKTDGTDYLDEGVFQPLVGICVNYVTTTTTPTTTIPATCQCPFQSLDSADLQSLIGSLPISLNISSYPISRPTTVTDSGNCSITLSCPIGYSLVLLDTTDYSYTSFGEVELNGFCQKSDQTWLVDGGDAYDYGSTSYSQLVSVCVDYSSSDDSSGDCACPAIGSITQTDIESLSVGWFLSDRNTSAVDVTVDGQCKITVDVSEINYADFYFMIIPENVPPIFSRRWLNTSSKTSTFSPTGIQCNSATAQWEYYGGALTNMTFAAQDNSGQCDCGPFPNTTAPIPGVCDIVQTSCTGLAQIFSENNKYTILLPMPGPQTIYNLLCSGDDWLYNGLPGLAFPETLCFDPPEDVLMNEYNFTYHCGCRDFIPITETNGYRTVYDYYYSNYTTTNTPTIVYPTDCTSSPQISCPNDSDLLFVGDFNGNPMTYSPSSPPPITCQPSPLVRSSISLGSGSMWIVDGVMLTDPAIGCFGP